MSRFSKHVCKLSKRGGAIVTQFTPLLLMACGSGSENSGGEANQGVGYSGNYTALTPTFTDNSSADTYAYLLFEEKAPSYWVDALSMNSAAEVIDSILFENSNAFHYSFASVQPNYDIGDIEEWSQASKEIIAAAREIFTKVNAILNVDFSETVNTDVNNVANISVSLQSNTAGLGYFPSRNYFEGSDIFISNKYTKPDWLENGLTNYDYEVLLHEIGHALGLKHPFETDGSNTFILNAHEDNTKFTTMSYDDTPDTFSGSFRPLDWLTLAELYGVNPFYKSEDNVYSFSATSGVFIIDGAGTDTIDASIEKADIYVDLRPGAHSWLGTKENFITSAMQLTISHGSLIENVFTGSGSDRIYGNDGANYIETQAGNDLIFPGEGSDTVRSGIGEDIIDLSETLQMVDAIIFEAKSEIYFPDTIYGFVQGVLGDVLDISALIEHLAGILPLVSASDVPFGHVDNCVVPIIYEEISLIYDLSQALAEGGSLSSLTIRADAAAVFVISPSQDAGEEQFIYCAKNDGVNISVHHLATLWGDHLDIDLWSLENFAPVDASLIA